MTDPRKGKTTGARSNPLAVLLQLGRRARQAEDEAELGFILVNETHQLVPYRQAVLWLQDGGVTALSGVVLPEANAPYVQWLNRRCREWFDQGRLKPWVVQPGDLSREDRNEWSQWLPAEAVCVPIPRVGQRFSGGLMILARDGAWSESEMGMLAEWAAIWGSVRALVEGGSPLGRLWQKLNGKPAPLQARHAPSMMRLLRNKRTWIWLLFIAAMLVPVRLTVLAPGELVPLQPSMVRAPMDGVIEHVRVLPNQAVSEGMLLFEFDQTSIRNRLLIAERSADTVRAELRQRSQQALFDDASSAQLTVLRGQLAEKELEVQYLRELVERSQVHASRHGIVLFDDPSEWIGRPVVTGERIMVIADEREAELEAWLSPANAIALEPRSRVSLFLNADPTRPLRAELRYVGHEALLRPDGQYAYRVRAHLPTLDERTRIGLKGTAKLEGDRVPLVYWIMRRPVAVIRAWLGL